MSSAAKAYSVRHISAAQARPLRHSVLRPHQSLDAVRYPGDEDADTVHFGVFSGEELVGIATLLRQPKPGTTDQAWQLRGMAMTEQHRGRGAGTHLLDSCITHLREATPRGAPHSVFWCHARQGAVEFYRKAGFASEGDFFDYQGNGPHIVMVRGVP